jgi:hypothetical protein
MLIGWDISTAIIGFAVFDNDCQFKESLYCDLRKIEGLTEKGDVAHQFVKDMVTNYKSSGDVHFIEDRLAGFSGGGSNAGTVMRLAAFNAMVCWMIHLEWKKSKTVMIHPSTVKATMKHEGLLIPKGADKKKLTLDFVVSREPKFPLELNRNGNPQPFCYDMSDGYITAVAGVKKQLHK